MWKRIKRAVNSNLGRFKTDPLSADGPSGKDIASLGESLEVVREQVSLLEKDLRRLQAEETTLNGRIRTALDGGNRPEALKHAGVLSKVREDIQRVSEQLERAREVCQKAERLYATAGGTPKAQTPFVPASELDAAAEDTLARLEGELINSGKLAGTPTPDRAVADSGPQESAAKTIGGAGREAEPSERTQADKTIGGSEPEPEPKPVKTLGDEAPAKEQAPEAKSGDSLLDELERLAKLKDQGILTDEEFQAAKKKLLG